MRSSKDLEKDEREWTIYLDEFDESMPVRDKRITVVPKARLQQVEAERDGLIRQSEKTEEYLGGKLQAAEDQGCRLADELSIAREALEELDAFRYKDRRAEVVKGALARLRLARLQAKEEGT